MSDRTDYDSLSQTYDTDPGRSKELDPDLLLFLNERSDIQEENLAILDIGCGTGNQLVADLQKLTGAKLVGLDHSIGMLSYAKRKSDQIQWIQGDGVALPLPSQSFDYITNQFSFHHIVDKPSFISEVFRVLRPKGRFVMYHPCPEKMAGWAVYQYFPKSWERDRVDFLSNIETERLLKQTGFMVEIELEYLEWEQELKDFLAEVEPRSWSNLTAIPDNEFEKGIQRIKQELQASKGIPNAIQNEYCNVKIRCEKTIKK